MILAEPSQYGNPHIGNAMPFAEGPAYTTTQQQYDYSMTRAPLFERMDSTLSGDHLTNELEECKRLLEDYKNKLSHSERTNAEIEHRLQLQGQKRMSLEANLSAKQRDNMAEFKAMSDEVEQWKQSFTRLERHNVNLRDTLNRTERELMGVLAKKYEIQEKAKIEARQQLEEEVFLKRGRSVSKSAPRTREIRDNPSSSVNNQSQRTHHQEMQQFPFQSDSPRDVRLRNVEVALNDFFGL